MSNTLTNSCTNLSKEIIASAKQVLGNYQSTLETILTSVNGDVSALVGTEFIGDAATAFQASAELVTKKLAEQVYGGEKSMVQLLNTMLTDSENQMIDTMDPALAKSNNSAADEMRDAAAAAAAN